MNESIKQVIIEMGSLASMSGDSILAAANLDTTDPRAEIVRSSAISAMTWAEYVAAKVDLGLPLTVEQLEEAVTVAHRAEAAAYKLALQLATPAEGQAPPKLPPELEELAKHLLVFAKGLKLVLLAFQAATAKK